MSVAIRDKIFQFEQKVKKWMRVEQNARNLKKGPFYKEEMDVAIRVESFQFGRSARKLKSVGKNARELKIHIFTT